MNDSIKKDFPQFNANPSLVYLDSTATSLTPTPVIETVLNYYNNSSSSVHRGIYPLAAKTTQEFEDARKVIADFIGAKDPSEIVFTRNATESLNVLANTLGDYYKDQPVDIITSISEHHSNFIPWQNLTQKSSNVTHRILGLTREGECAYTLFDAEDAPSANPQQLAELISEEKNTIVSLAHISNVLGTIQPIQEISKVIKAKNQNALFILDACQSVPHKKINVHELGVDALVFSGHKMCGPTGIGVLWAKKELLEKLNPFLFGGEMVQEVYVDQPNVYKDAPLKFEAGTPHVAGALGLAAAAEYLQNIGLEEIEKHENQLVEYFFEKAAKVEGFEIIGPKNQKKHSATISFTFKHFHPHDIADFLGEKNIAVRAGLHCAMPLHEHLGLPATTRASFYLYNTTADIDAFFNTIEEFNNIFSK